MKNFICIVALFCCGIICVNVEASNRGFSRSRSVQIQRNFGRNVQRNLVIQRNVVVPQRNVVVQRNFVVQPQIQRIQRIHEVPNLQVVEEVFVDGHGNIQKVQRVQRINQVNRGNVRVIQRQVIGLGY